MSVFYVNLALFFETTAGVLGFLAFLALTREYFRRRQRHLALFGLAMLAMAGSYLVLFLGQIVDVLRPGQGGQQLIFSFQYGAAMQALFLLLAAAELASKESRKTAYRAAAFFFTAVAFVSIAATPGTVLSVSGYKILDLESSRSLLNFLPTFAGAAGMILLGWKRSSPHGERDASDSFFVSAGVVTFGLVAMRLIAFPLELYWFALFFMVGHIAIAYLITFAAIAKGHPDPRIAAAPTLYFRQRLLYKAASLSVGLFWILAYMLVIVASWHFVQGAVETRKNGLQRDVHVFSRMFASSTMLFLEETARLATIPTLPSLVGRDPAVLPPAFRDFVHPEQAGTRIMRIMDDDGVVLFSTFSEDEVGQLLDSALLRKALGGTKAAATEHEDALGPWALRAAVPVRLSDGASGGVLPTTDLSAALDFGDYMAISPVLANGYGYVTETGATAFSSGQVIDEFTKSELRRQLGQRVANSGTLASGDFYFLNRTPATDGTSNGFFYIVLGRERIESEAFGILALVTLIVHLILLFVVAILAFAMSATLRPIKELRAAASRVEHDQYDVRISYKAPDEIGELASAYNRMSGAMAERTTRLREALREQRDFLEHAVNGMRTPINVFRWTLDMMRYGDTGKLNQQQLEFLEQMHQTNERLIRLVANMRDVLHLDRGSYALRPELFQIEDLVDEAAGDLAVAARERNITLHWMRPKGLPRVRADRDALRKILTKLLSNAVKYNQFNGHIEIRVSKSGSNGPRGATGAYVMVAVEDSGRGVPPGEGERIFTRFYRTKSAVSDEIEGSGLGLYISQRLVELQGGRIWFESKENVGTTFFFTIPADHKAQ